jgi:hypothetical protein
MDDPVSTRPQLSPVAKRAPGAVAHAPKSKPDARPMRIALGAAGLAAFSAIVSAIVLPPRPVVQAPALYGQQAVPGGPGSVTTVQAPIQYVQLQPGQTAPAGATVVDSSARPAAAAVPAPALKPVIIRTTQSGKVIP